MLDRDELQGVIGHEFSHILNGDMRLNIRLMGVLFGIMSLGLMGRMIFRGVRYTGLSSKRGKGAPVVVILGLGLIILGAVGVFFARIIKAGVSRQREYLADASSVQFTRQSSGLASALKKIGGYESPSLASCHRPRRGQPHAVRHRLATEWPVCNPSAADRAHPGTGSKLPRDGLPAVVQLRDRAHTTNASSDVRQAGIAAASNSSSNGTPQTISESVGRPTGQHVAFAASVRQSIPEALYDAAHSVELSYLLVVALIMDRSGRVLERQLSMVSERLGEQRARIVRQQYEALQKAAPEYRLPLLEIAFPVLRQRPAPQLVYLIELTRRLIEVDGVIDLHEFCCFRVLASNLRHSITPSQMPKTRRADRKPVREAAVNLLRIVAHYGHSDAGAAAAAFRAGLSAFGGWGDAIDYSAPQDVSTTALDDSLDLLVALNGDGRQMLLDAVTKVVSHDQRLTVIEKELVRAVCASLEIPLPPIIGVSLNSVPDSGSHEYA